MHDGNLRYALLGLLACHEGGAHGYRLQREAQAICEHPAQVTFGRVYRALEALERHGDVDGRHEVQDGRPNRRTYRLTEHGRRTFEEWLAEPPEANAYPLRDELALKLRVAGSADLAVVACLVGGYRSVCIERLECVGRRRAVLRRSGLDAVLGELVAGASEARIRAELEWLEQLERRLIRNARMCGPVSPRPS